VFHLPREQAAQSFGVGLTYLKKICRDRQGRTVQSWPSRKIHALNSTIDRIAELRDAASPERSHLGDSLIADVEAMRSEVYELPHTPLLDMDEILVRAAGRFLVDTTLLPAVPEKPEPVTGVGVPVATQCRL
jgi:hypothetical protein